jgi:hypothetical protein
LRQPLKQPIAAVEPINWPIDRGREGVEEIEAERVGDENSRRSVQHDDLSNQAKDVLII